ncbi:hypothetical protein DKL56_03795 [Lactobacillus apis]|uniref:hypothetical protein n=1 Tax=Lactobacillus apis TaxID=303541 RepID=UPI000D6B4934|nr:hypothetical protein [Lactobacillus apis]AWM73675.1 hypothetical protein DKL56_03795 [Lactobacillus apis]
MKGIKITNLYIIVGLVLLACGGWSLYFKKRPSKNKVVNTINGLVDTIQQLTIGFVHLEETTDLTGKQKMNKVIDMVTQSLKEQGLPVPDYVIEMIKAFAEQEVAKIKKENK